MVSRLPRAARPVTLSGIPNKTRQSDVSSGTVRGAANAAETLAQREGYLLAHPKTRLLCATKITVIKKKK